MSRTCAFTTISWLLPGRTERLLPAHHDAVPVRVEHALPPVLPDIPGELGPQELQIIARARLVLRPQGHGSCLRAPHGVVQHLGAHALVPDRLPPDPVVEGEAHLARGAAPAVDGVPHRAAPQQRAQERGLAPLRGIVEGAPAQRLVLVPCGRAAVEQGLEVGGGGGCAAASSACASARASGGKASVSVSMVDR